MEAIENKFELRKLEAKDIMPICRIISKIGINNFKKCFDNEELKTMVSGLSEEDKKDNAKVTAVGMTVALEIADVLFTNLPNCEKELFAFTADVAGKKLVEVQSLSMADFFELVIEIIKKDEFKDFFKVASKSFT